MTSPEQAASAIVQTIVAAALGGADDAALLALLGDALAGAGLDVPTIEVSCDVVDPERERQDMRWSRGAGGIERSIRAREVFWSMLATGAPRLRLGDDPERFAPALGPDATDALALATHLEPDATLGFFDDVMALFVTGRPGGFTDGEVALLGRVAPAFGLALGARLNADAARALLRTYLGRDAATAMLGGRLRLGAVERMRAVVIYCDLAGFTTLTERLEAQALIDTLNLFFETVTHPVRQAGGEVSGHVGDAVVLFLPIETPDAERSRCGAALAAVREGLDALERLNAAPGRCEAPRLRARVGIDVGAVVSGNIGSAGRLSFTIIGTPVNRAARLQALAKELGASVLLPAALAEAAGFADATAFGEHVLRGLERPVRVVGLPGDHP